LKNQNQTMSKEIIEGYRLSPQQKHLWLLGQSERSAACVVRIDGELNPDLLQEAIRQVVERFEILRTTFKLLPGMTIPVQIISDRPDFEFYTLAEHALIERKIDHERPPLRVFLRPGSSTQHTLIVSLPAVSIDVASFQYLVSEIAAAYAGNPRAEETMQYADFAEWQNELLEGEAGSAARRFWKNQDLSEVESVKFSFEKQTGAFYPASLQLEISASTTERIKAVANRPSSFLLACWQILIARHTGSSNPVAGVLFDGRKFSELENAVGLFSTFLPVRADLSNDLTFENLMQQAAAIEHEAQRWQEYFSWDSFFPFCFEFHKRAEMLSAGDVKFSLYERDACIDRFKLKFVVNDCDDRFRTSLQFDANVFEIPDVERLVNQLKTLIEDASHRPNAAVADLEMLSDDERQLVLAEFNPPERFVAKQTVCELFEAQVLQSPDDLALVCEAEMLNRRELNARANQLAHHLIKLGVGPDVPVGLCLERSVDLIVALLGILKAGGAYVPLDPGLPVSRRSLILEEAGVRVLVSRAELSADLPSQLVCLTTDAEVIAGESTENPASKISDQNLAYVIFTSGSTGRPKGVAVEHRQVVNYTNAIWETLGLPAGSSFASVSTIAADLGNTAVFPALCKGGTLHLIAEEDSADPDRLAEYFEKNQIDCLKIVPTHLAALLSAADPAAILPRRRLVLGGEACPWSLVERISSLKPDCTVLNHYGPTEATVGALTNEVRNEDQLYTSETVPLGRPLTNVRAYILDHRMQPTPIGVPGELHLAGSGVARGYINRPDGTAEKFVPNPFGNPGDRLYKTGDRARYLPDGKIEFLGRVDHQLKIRGYRIEPGEIERALLSRKEVVACVVIGREDQPGDKRLVAYVVRREGEKAGASELRAFLVRSLPEYMVPSAFVFFDRMPLTPNGKVDRAALPAPAHSRPDEKVYTPPRHPVEETLAQIWSSVLNVDRISVNDNFFELGGDSILIIQIVARANRAGIRLSPRQMFQHQTIAELAAVAGTATVPVAPQEAVTGRVVLTPVQARFFEVTRHEPHHYNQAVLLEVHAKADTAVFAKAIEKLLLHHDALRLRFVDGQDGWQATIAAPDHEAPFEVVDLSTLDEAEQSRAVETKAARLHASLNLQEGPLMRVALFDRGPQRSSYLLIVIHHLAVDGVSWQILLEDLQALLSSGEVPSKTTSFQHWAELVREHARSAVLRNELPYWLAIGDHLPTPLQWDKAGGSNTVAEARTVSVSLNADDTRAVLQEVPVAYSTHINEVLLTALVRAFAPWTGSKSLLIDLEGHGREEIFEGVDLSRTVGWFTTIFPVVLNSSDAESIIEDLRSMKEQLRLIPNRGLGFGMLRYGSGGSELEKLPQAEVRFNYLGQVDRVLAESSMFSIAPQSSGPTQSAGASRKYLLNIIAMVSGGELRLDWTYSTSIHHKETVERLAQSFVEELRGLIARSRTGDKIDYSPSDFPRAKLSQDELNKVLAKLRG
jgi:amino acid adenylation domain-containing protein/non-ribosomal peptide synthase protein (TIGR01720 family)